MATMHFMEIVGFLSRCYNRMPVRKCGRWRRSATCSPIWNSTTQQPLTIEELLKVAHMSQSSLFRTFRQIMGRTPLDYLIHLRIGKAAQLLQRSTMRIREVSDAVGFT